MMRVVIRIVLAAMASLLLATEGWTQPLALSYPSPTYNNVNIFGNATIGGALGISGAATFSGGMAGTLTGHATLDLPLTGGNVSGDSTFSGSGTGLTVTNNTTIGGTLGVTGATSLATGGGATTVGGTLGVTGNTSLSNATTSGTLGVSGNTSLSNATTSGTLGVGTNETVGGTLGVTGATSLATGGGATTVGGTLGVTGATTHTGATQINNTLGVTGNTTLSNATIGGTLGVTGNTSLANTQVNGTLGTTGATSLTTGGGATVVGGTLAVTGVSTLTGGISAPITFAPTTAPSSLGTWGSYATSFNGDNSHISLGNKYSITGAASLGQPITGYVYTPELTPMVTYLYNTSGWNQDTADNGGRTSAVAFRTYLYQAGQGDMVAYNATAYVTGAKAGATSFLANPASSLFNGDETAGNAGVYLNPGEFALSDAGYDVSAMGWVINLNRTNNTGALGTVWMGYRVQSTGTKNVDAFFSGNGSALIGLDLTGMTGGTIGIALPIGAGIYGNASHTGLFPTTTTIVPGGDVIQDNATAGWQIIQNAVEVMDFKSTVILTRVPLNIGSTSSISFSALPGGTPSTYACFTSGGQLISSATAC
jgi:hypothetical protein